MNDQRYRVGKDKYGDVQGTRLSVIKDTARIGLLKDWHNNDNNLGSGMWVSHIIPPAPGECWHHRGEGSVVAFFDGHAKYVKGGELKNDSFYFDPDP